MRRPPRVAGRSGCRRQPGRCGTRSWRRSSLRRRRGRRCTDAGWRGRRGAAGRAGGGGEEQRSREESRRRRESPWCLHRLESVSARVVGRVVNRSHSVCYDSGGFGMFGVMTPGYSGWADIPGSSSGNSPAISTASARPLFTISTCTTDHPDGCSSPSSSCAVVISAGRQGRGGTHQRRVEHGQRHSRVEERVIRRLLLDQVQRGLEIRTRPCCRLRPGSASHFSALYVGGRRKMEATRRAGVMRSGVGWGERRAGGEGGEQGAAAKEEGGGNSSSVLTLIRASSVFSASGHAMWQLDTAAKFSVAIVIQRPTWVGRHHHRHRHRHHHQRVQ